MVLSHIFSPNHLFTHTKIAMALDTADHHYLLFHPMEDNFHHELDVLPAGPMVAHAGEAQRIAIIDAVNRTWDDGISFAMHTIPPLIAVGTQVYFKEPTALALRHVKTTPVLFVWLKASEVITFTSDAVFAVAFAIASSPKYHLLDLAWVLARLT
ncbi:hypothetical protein C8F01DRAFT_1251448 [Mycena amicta]|nr:hypothetical protein C8F01DRAFT_1251448 [Mycena amicta]